MGAMYRALPISHAKWTITLIFLIKKHLFIVYLLLLEFKFNAAVGFVEMYLNDVNVEKEIRTIEVSGVSKVAEIDEVRTKLVEQQQEMGNRNCYGSHATVFP
jgi:cytidylate kinase